MCFCNRVYASILITAVCLWRSPINLCLSMLLSSSKKRRVLDFGSSAPHSRQRGPPDGYSTCKDVLYLQSLTTPAVLYWPSAMAVETGKNSNFYPDTVQLDPPQQERRWQWRLLLCRAVSHWMCYLLSPSVVRLFPRYNPPMLSISVSSNRHHYAFVSGVVTAYFWLFDRINVW